jgi:uncharacterized protein (DUF885 family)
MPKLSRRTTLAASAAVLAVGGPNVPSAAEDAAETTRFNDWLEERFKFWTNRSPIAKGYLGLKEDMDKWDDIGEARQVEDHDLYRKDLARLMKDFDRAKLSSAAQLSHRLFEYQTNQRIANFRWRKHDYPVNQMFGWQSEIPSFLINIHGISTPAEAEAYIARLNGIPVLFDQVIAGIKDRQAAGVVPPKFVHAHVIRDCRNVLKGKPFDISAADSTLLEDFRGKVKALSSSDGVKARLLSDAEKALLGAVKPAFERMIGVVEEQAKGATADDGVWKLPDGAAFYEHQLRYHTTTDMTAAQIHDFGLADVARIHGEMREIMRKVSFTGDLKAFFKFMQTDARFYYPQTVEGKSAYVKRATEIIDAMRGRLDQVFATKPKARLIVKEVEPFREQSAAAAFYQGPGAFDGRPGTYYANTYDMKAMPKYEMEALAYHEAIPGHHMQIAIAQELDGVPSFRKFSNDYTAYVEGWGLYCERLPVEMGGFYGDPYSDFGRLSMELWRACRLVVDTGIHSGAKKWTRVKAIQFMFDNTPNSETDIVTEIERYIVMPGQATAYKIGMTKLVDLREKARKALGAKFDIRQYHDIVLLSGPVPLTMLEENVDAWIKSKAA